MRVGGKDEALRGAKKRPAKLEKEDDDDDGAIAGIAPRSRGLGVNPEAPRGEILMRPPTES